MTSKFFRFLSRRGSKSATKQSNMNVNNNILNNTSHTTALNIFGIDADSRAPGNLNSNNKHTKLKEGGEDLKETIEHYNQRCMTMKQQFSLDEQKM